MISLAPSLAPLQMVFFVWVSLSEHKWVILAERRGILPVAAGSLIMAGGAWAIS